MPAFDKGKALSGDFDRRALLRAVSGWLRKTPSFRTHVNYSRDLHQFLNFANIDLEALTTTRPEQVAAWSDDMKERGFINSTIRRKMTALRALFSYLLPNSTASHVTWRYRRCHGRRLVRPPTDHAHAA
jgi:hypothetical protein